MTQPLYVSRFVADTYFELEGAYVVFHPFSGKTYKLDGVGMGIFQSLLSTPLTEKQIIKSVSAHSPSIDQRQVHSILQELKALELIQAIET